MMISRDIILRDGRKSGPRKFRMHGGAHVFGGLAVIVTPRGREASIR